MMEQRFEAQFERSSKWFPSLSGTGAVTVSRNGDRIETIKLEGVKVWGGQTVISVALQLWAALLSLGLLLFVIGLLAREREIATFGVAIASAAAESFAFLITFGILVAYLTAVPGALRTRVRISRRITRLRSVRRTPTGVAFSTGGLLPIRVQIAAEESLASAIADATTGAK